MRPAPEWEARIFWYVVGLIKWAVLLGACLVVYYAYKGHTEARIVVLLVTPPILYVLYREWRYRRLQ